MEIIGRIYEALDDDEALEALPQRLAEAVGGRSATLMLHSPEMTLEEIYTHYFSPDMAEFYAANNIDRFDEWSKIMERETAGIGKTIRVGDFQSREDYEKSFFYREFIRNFGDDSAFCIGFGSNRVDGGMVTLGVHKGRSADDFSDEQLALLEMLRPHITRMAMLRRSLISEAQFASGALLGVNQIEDGYFVLRTDRCISFANAAAEALLQRHDLLQASEGKLYLHRIQDDEKLASALSDANNNSLAGKLSFVAMDKPGCVWRFTLAPKTFDGETLVLVWIDRCKAGASAPQAMQQIYGLTQAELPILMAVSQGLSAAEISDQQHISITTVRSHIQHIYQKTGVNKATQLAQLVASLPRVR